MGEPGSWTYFLLSDVPLLIIVLLFRKRLGVTFAKPEDFSLYRWLMGGVKDL